MKQQFRASQRRCLVGLVTVLWASPVRAQSVGDDAYRAAIETGVQEFDLGHYQEALAAFERAYAMRPGSRVLRGIAKVRFEFRQYTATIAAAEAALSHPDGNLTAAMRTEVEALRARAYAFTGTVAMQITPETAEILLDGRPLTPQQLAVPVRVDVGSHEFTVSAPGYSTARRTVDIVGGGETQLVVVALTTGGRNPLPYISAGVALVGAGGVVASALWMVDRGDAIQRCQVASDRGGNCVNGAALASENDLALGTLIGASVLTVAGGITFFLSLRSGARAAAPPIAFACEPRPGGALCAGGVRW